MSQVWGIPFLWGEITDKGLYSCRTIRNRIKHPEQISFAVYYR